MRRFWILLEQECHLGRPLQACVSLELCLLVPWLGCDPQLHGGDEQASWFGPHSAVW